MLGLTVFYVVVGGSCLQDTIFPRALTYVRFRGCELYNHQGHLPFGHKETGQFWWRAFFLSSFVRENKTTRRYPTKDFEISIKTITTAATSF